MDKESLTAVWQDLQAHQINTSSLHMRDWFQADPDRFDTMHETLHGLLFDYSKNRISEETLGLLCRLADAAGVKQQAEAMRCGEKINLSEHRAVLHTALRLPADAPAVSVNGKNVLPDIHRELERALAFAENLLSGTHTGATGKRITDFVHICEEAIEHQFFSVCINSCHIPLAKHKLQGTNVKICTVVGFPLGANLSSVKAFETTEAIKAGAQEIDMVINVGWIKSGKWEQVRSDIQAVLTACNGIPLKVILETCLLSKAEIIQACEICKALNVTFVKTSTGFNKNGATIEDIALMRQTVGSLGVKASG